MEEEEGDPSRVIKPKIGNLMKLAREAAKVRST